MGSVLDLDEEFNSTDYMPLFHTPWPVKRKSFFCGKGHPLTGDNVRSYKNGKYITRICQACRRERARLKRERDGAG